MEFRRQYGYDTQLASALAVVYEAGEAGESLTVQSMAEDADINVMLQRFGVTGQMPQGAQMLTYGDFTGINDYQSAIHAVHDAEDRFMALPANVRARFENDPQQFLDFCTDKGNLPELRKLGLAPEVISNGDDKGSTGSTGTKADGSA